VRLEFRIVRIDVAAIAAARPKSGISQIPEITDVWNDARDAGPGKEMAVCDENRPYLGCITAGAIDATLDFLRRELVASGWSPLSAAGAAVRWPER